MSSARLPAPRRKEQLLDVAMHVFAERGFHLTSMNEVADAAGVTKPVLYQHFPSKRALYLELLRSVGARLLEEIEGAARGADNPREQVENGLRAYFSFVAEHPAAYRVMFGGGTRRDTEFAEEAAAVERSMATVIADLIAVDSLDEADRLLHAHGIVGLAEGATRHWMNDSLELDPEAVAVRVADLAWRGLRGIGSGR
jgi:AcrR family transcriptional regulator